MPAEVYDQETDTWQDLTQQNVPHTINRNTGGSPALYINTKEYLGLWRDKDITDPTQTDSA